MCTGWDVYQCFGVPAESNVNSLINGLPVTHHPNLRSTVIDSLHVGFGRVLLAGHRDAYKSLLTC